MEKLFDKAAPKLAKSAEGIQIKKLVRRILQYDPLHRPAVAEILQDPWFTRDDWGTERVDDPGYEDDDREEDGDEDGEERKEEEEDDDNEVKYDEDEDEDDEEMPTSCLGDRGRERTRV